MAPLAIATAFRSGTTAMPWGSWNPDRERTWRLPAVSMTSTVLFPSAATNRRLVAGSNARWSIRPDTPGSGTVATLRSAVGESADSTAAIMASRRTLAARVTIISAPRGNTPRRYDVIFRNHFTPGECHATDRVPRARLHGGRRPIHRTARAQDIPADIRRCWRRSTRRATSRMAC